MTIRNTLRGMGNIKEEDKEITKLKKTIKITYITFYYIFVFLLVVTIGKYLFWKPLGYFVEIGITISWIWLYKIKKAMKKKEREDKKEEEIIRIEEDDINEKTI